MRDIASDGMERFTPKKIDMEASDLGPGLYDVRCVFREIELDDFIVVFTRQEILDMAKRVA